MDLPSVRRPVAVFFVAVFVLLAAFVAGVAALHYEFYLVGTGVDAMQNVVEVYGYADLPPGDQSVVDAAIGGQRFVYTATGPIPGYGSADFGEQVGVVKSGTTYIFARQLFFDVSSRSGLVSVALACVGLSLFGYALRLDMTPRH